MSTADTLIAPTSCGAPKGQYDGRCQSKRFKRAGNDYFECLECGAERRGRVRPHTEMRLASCRDCGKPFLYRFDHRGHATMVPTFCRACIAEASAMRHERMAGKARASAARLRASQRRAVARFKPPESRST